MIINRTAKTWDGEDRQEIENRKMVAGKVPENLEDEKTYKKVRMTNKRRSFFCGFDRIAQTARRNVVPRQSCSKKNLNKI